MTASTAPIASFERNTIPRLFFYGIDSSTSGAPALKYKLQGIWRDVTHREVEQQVARLVTSMAGLGIEAGDRIAILSENRPEWSIVDFAAACSGVIDVPIYPTLPPTQVAYILKDCEARAAFVSTRTQLEKVLAIRDEIPSLQWIITFDDDTAGGEAISFEQMIGTRNRQTDAEMQEDLRRCALLIEPDQTATIIYTSGTTGPPKGVTLSHLNLAYMVAATRQHGSVEASRGDTALSFLPLSHILERAIEYFYWDEGMTIAFAESVQAVAENLREVQPHMVVSVPRLFEKIHTAVVSSKGVKGKLIHWALRVGGAVVDARMAGQAAPASLLSKYRLADKLVFSKIRKQTGGRIKTFVSGGAPLSPEVARFLFAAGMTVHEGYGLTETSPVLTANRPGNVRFGTVGVPFPGVELKLAPSGEILARSPGVMKGYWNAEEATKEVIDADGWFHTGDIGELDADGYLRITDRIKDIIVTAGGKNIAPQPIELHAAASPFVAQAVMIGDRRPYPVMLIVPNWDLLDGWAGKQGIDISNRDKAVSDDRLLSFFEQEIRSRLDGFAQYELPKKLRLIARDFSIDAGTLTPSLKVRRNAIEQLYKQIIDGLYSEASLRT